MAIDEAAEASVVEATVAEVSVAVAVVAAGAEVLAMEAVVAEVAAVEAVTLVAVREPLKVAFEEMASSLAGLEGVLVRIWELLWGVLLELVLLERGMGGNYLKMKQAYGERRC